MELPKDIKDLASRLYKLAIENLIRDGSLMPVSFVLFEDGQFMVVALASMNTDEEKEATAAALHQMAAKPNARAVIMILEAWSMTESLKGLSEEDKQAIRENPIRPSTCPLRKEILSLQIAVKDMDCEFLGMNEISRDENKKPMISNELPKMNESRDFEGRFQGFFVRVTA